jgi:hypothetical protein
MTRDEHELKRLFGTMREADAQAAPRFAGMTAARVLARPAPADPGYLRALVAAIIVIAVLASVNIARRHESSPASTSQSQNLATQRAQRTARSAPSESKAAAGGGHATRAPRYRPVTLSQWKSPTAALLDTPGDELWTTVPKLGTQAKSEHESKSLHE